ncbi:MAG: sigma-70 family RNA polymerase sigma factor, partial [Chitinophagaceae bacterium]
MRQLKIATQITNRDSQAVEKYLQEISKISMITPEEETTLAQRIKMFNRNPVDSQRALDKLVQANLRFVVSVAKQYQHQGLSLSDLINEGNLGLIKAAQRFDETKGFKFISYAVWWIRQSILQALAEQGRLVRLPQNKIGTYNKANKAYMAFEQEHEREPSTEELAELLEMSETEINNIFQSNTRHT